MVKLGNSPQTDASTAVLDQTHPDMREALPWVTVVWDDPVNLMSYVTHVFESHFGYSRPRCEELMLQVHHDGRAIVSSGGREEMERDVTAMHSYGLWATLDRAE